MSIPAHQVWQRLPPALRQEVVTEINYVLMEVLDEHFRIDLGGGLADVDACPSSQVVRSRQIENRISYGTKERSLICGRHESA